MSRARFAVATLLLLVLAGCGAEYPQSSISPTSDFAEIIHSLYVSVFWWTMVILAVVWLILAYILVRFRARDDRPHPKQIHGHLGLEIGWTVGPALIVVAIAVPTIQAVFETQRERTGEEYVVEVIGHRYWWEFRYPEEGVVTANELHLPVGRRVALRMHSVDVVHSFWVPQLGGKRDLNPLRRVPQGENPRYNWLRFTITEPGVYMGQCAEFCGHGHSLMGLTVVAQEEGEFREWLGGMGAADAATDTAAAPDTAGATTTDADAPAETAGTAAPAPPDGQAAQEEPEIEVDTAAARTPAADTPAAAAADEWWADPGLIEEGRRGFHEVSYCGLCHSTDPTRAVPNLGPNLGNLGSRATIGAGRLENTPGNLITWITHPRAVKPDVYMPGTETAAPRLGQEGEWPVTGLTPEQVRAVAAYLTSLK